MQQPVRISFHGVNPSDAVEVYVREHAAKLERYFDRITGCRVTIERSHRHKSHDHPDTVRVDVTVPRHELVVTRSAARSDEKTDLYATIDAAFGHAARLVQDYAERRRGDVKTHESASRGNADARSHRPSPRVTNIERTT